MNGKQVRFVAKGLRSHRERLGVSAGELAKLIGVSAQSVYNWEHEVTSPREGQLGALAALRSPGEREVRARLQQIDGAQAGKRAPAAKVPRARKPSKRPARRGGRK